VTTYCNRCTHVFRVYKNDPPQRWLCSRHPRLEGFGFVTETTWDNAPPYLYCRDVNGGKCPMYLETKPTTEESNG
jgi:hypothetical protein